MSKQAQSVFQGELPNGIRWMHYQTHGYVAYAGVMLGVGSRDELAHQWGVAHLLEHMFFKGTTRRNAFQVSNRVESVGGEINAYTSKEETAIHAAFMPGYLARILELLADIIARPTFPEHQLERERDVILEEIASYRDTPSELIYDEFEELLFSDHPLAHSILGVPRNIRKCGRGDILAFQAEHYSPERMVVCTAGPFSPKRVGDTITRFFTDLPLRGGSKRVLSPPQVQARGRSLRRRTAQAHCIVGGIGLSMRDERLPALALLSNILGGEASTSRLNRSIREKEGLAYTVESSLVSYLDTGLFAVYFGTDKNQVNRCFDILLRELRQLATHPLSTLQFSRAKRQFLGQLYLSSDNAEALMLSGARRILEGLPLLSLEDTQRELDALQPMQLADLVNELMRPEQLSTLLYH